MTLKFIRRKLHNFSIQNKMVLSFLSICTLCFSVLFFIGIPQLAKSSKKNIIYSAKQAQEQAQDYISYMMNALRQSCYSFAYDDRIIEIVSKSNMDYTYQQQTADKQTLENHIAKLKNSHYKTISDITLYLNGDFSFVSNHAKPFLAFDLIKDQEWYIAMNHTPYAYYLIPPQWNTSPNYISVVHMISHPEDFSQFVGALVLDTPVENIKNILQKCAVTPNSYAYLINDEGVLVCSSVENPIPIHTDSLPTIYSPTLSYSDESNLYSLSRLDTCRWTLIQVIPKKDIWEASFNIIRYFILIGLIMLVLSVILSLKVSTSITKRISMLSRIMRNFRYEKSKIIPVDEDGDDVDYLLSSYNQLIADFDTLTAENIQKSQQLNETELALLHSQIKPHFLYNTLAMIRSLADHNQPEKASLAIRALSGFYKSGLGTKTLWSTLDNELNHIKFYMEIQRLRYGNNINLDIQVEKEFLDVNLPKITLQPIVENALIHGILNKAKKQGTITISTSTNESSDLHITIRDDGCGLSQDALTRLFHSSQSGTGIGLWNTNERIRIHYGAAYGLSVQSVPNEFTEITIRIPIIRGKELTNDNTDCR